MPPKGKAVETAKKKTVEDKTFGLKNKNKSVKVQKFIKNVEATVLNKGKDGRPISSTKADLEAMKAAKEAKAQEELSKMLKAAIVQPKVPFGVDPKTIMCEFFKVGQCNKGDKCKFSHDNNVARKSAKINLYTDVRNDAPQDDTPLTAAEESDLAAAAMSEANKIRGNDTDIVCKFFIEAVEKQKYGWFWKCPNGNDTCRYRHALPPGFVLKSQKKINERMENCESTIEEKIDEARRAIPEDKKTPVTLERFLDWKRCKDERKAKLVAEDELKAQSDYKKGGRTVMSGRHLFTYDPSIFIDDDEAAVEIERQDSSEEDEDDDNENEDNGNNNNGSNNVIGDESLFLDDDGMLPEDDDDDDDDDEDRGEQLMA